MITQNTPPTDHQIFTIRQASQLLKASSLNLRRYCNRGFIPGLKHPQFGRTRTFTTAQLDWLRLAHFLTQAGLTTREIRKYIILAQTATPEARHQQKAILSTHKRQVWQKIEDLQATIDFLERQEEILESQNTTN